MSKEADPEDPVQPDETSMSKDVDLENPTKQDEATQEDADVLYPARLEIDYPEGDIDRMTVVAQIVKIVPVLFLWVTVNSTLFLSTLLMIVFQEKYPKWWFDFSLEHKRYTYRVFSFCAMMSDKWPSTTDGQNVHLEIDFPGESVVTLNRWAPLYKILLGIPHLFILFCLFIATLLAVIGVWFTVLIKGRYPRVLFDFLVGVFRWELRVHAYAFLLVTDKYPPFSLE